MHLPPFCFSACLSEEGFALRVQDEPDEHPSEAAGELLSSFAERTLQTLMALIKIAEKQLEYVWQGPGPTEAPTLVFLHEGLGCVAMWRDFPERLAIETGCGALVYSRAGYGKSDPIELPRPVRFMHEEALVTLPRVLDAFEIRDAILVGHSDGGSIAIIYAGAEHEGNFHHERTKDTKAAEGKLKNLVRGLILEAPHVFVEEGGLESIRSISAEYRQRNLKKALARYHGENVDATFWGWNDVWLNPEFKSWNIEEYLPHINVPVLLIQGEDDRYGTLEQVRKIEAGCRKSVRTILLSDCGHTPHLEQPERTLEAMKEFVGEVFCA
jgi:pimeloyl-ACP methyl ester carboxylesterase